MKMPESGAPSWLWALICGFIIYLLAHGSFPKYYAILSGAK